MNRRVLGFVMGITILGAVASGASGEAPVTVSPGSGPGFSAVASHCPTFSWGQVEQAKAYELVVYRVDKGNSIDVGDEMSPIIRERLPGSAQSWTPPLSQCLSPGESYAWSIRAAGATGDSAWSETSLFEVGGSPSLAEVDEALRILQQYLQETGPEVESSGSTRPSAAAPGVESLGSGIGATSSPERVEIVSALRRQLAVRRGLDIHGAAEAPAVKTVTPPGTYSLVTDGAVSLGGEIFKEGKAFLHTDGGDAGRNTGLGLDALVSIGSGERNTAIGHSAGMGIAGGDTNTAVGSFAFNQGTGTDNTVIGASALVNQTGGDNNIAIGSGAGFFSNSNSNNILLGSFGFADDDNAIHIGEAGIHSYATIAGDLGLGTQSPQTRLHIKDAIAGSSLNTHVAVIENTLDDSNSDGLAIKIDSIGVYPSNNYVTFYSGGDFIVGQIEGDSPLGITYASTFADYAEWLRKRDSSEEILPGEVVGLFGDQVSRETVGAEGVMVVSTGPIVAGNDPGEENRQDYSRVAFIGQVDVKVTGEVQQGDYLIPSGRSDGRAVAVEAEAMTPHFVRQVIGRALEATEGPEDDDVRIILGITDGAPMAAVMDQQAKMIAAQQRELARQGLELAEMKERLRTLPILEANR